jgi:hypothetical protein
VLVRVVGRDAGGRQAQLVPMTALQQAAFALYGEGGFDNTTAAEIAERAGQTKRTFFRYFADKREVLFYGSETRAQPRSSPPRPESLSSGSRSSAGSIRPTARTSGASCASRSRSCAP